MRRHEQRVARGWGGLLGHHANSAGGQNRSAGASLDPAGGQNRSAERLRHARATGSETLLLRWELCEGFAKPGAGVGVAQSR
jgi:hypothetical protein